ncbi:hypothetical protein ST37_10810 [Vibrio sp. qd031]|nr:hypothetical protein ST37_10810 [Vibrio sp. qd031]
MTKKIASPRYYRVTLNAQIMLVCPCLVLSIYSLVTGEGRAYAGVIFALFLSVNFFRDEIKYLFKFDRRFLFYFVTLNILGSLSVKIYFILPTLCGILSGLFIGFYSVYRYDKAIGSDTQWEP